MDSELALLVWLALTTPCERARGALVSLLPARRLRSYGFQLLLEIMIISIVYRFAVMRTVYDYVCSRIHWLNEFLHFNIAYVATLCSYLGELVVTVPPVPKMTNQIALQPKMLNIVFDLAIVHTHLFGTPFLLTKLAS